MALVELNLKNDLLTVFQNMADAKDGDAYFAENVSAKIASYVQSGSITTTDTGTISAGVFVGTGTGSMSVQSGVCENVLSLACNAMRSMSAGGNEYLATQMALAIDSMMIAGTVNTTVSGTVTTPSGVPSPITGNASGKFVGVSATLQGAFLMAFSAMDTIKENGNDFLAGKIASAVTSYLKAGVITTQGELVLIGSVGTGVMV